MFIDFKALAAPFPPSAIHWRAQTLTRDGDKALALAYLDARDVMDRLDEICGPENWKDSYIETARGRTICTLEIRTGGEWVGKSDGSGDTDVEGEKGSISGALKRAAVKWGVGRYLYDLGNVWAPCESYDAGGKKRWRKWLPSADVQFKKALEELGGPLLTITNDQRDLIQQTAEAAGVPLIRICEGAGVDSLKALPANKYEAVMKKLNLTIEKKVKEEENG